VVVVVVVGRKEKIWKRARENKKRERKRIKEKRKKEKK
jgi:hypothetical protein